MQSNYLPGCVRNLPRDDMIERYLEGCLSLGRGLIRIVFDCVLNRCSAHYLLELLFAKIVKNRF